MTQSEETRPENPPVEHKAKLPRDLADVTPQWLTSILDTRYPGIVVKDMQVIEVKNSHTTKLRVALDLNEIGQAAGIPRNVCLKANWSEGFESGNITELEANFYYFMREHINVPIPKSYFADWDGNGYGVVMMEDLGSSPGEFGNSSHHLGVDGVAKGLESLALLHATLWNSPLLDEQPWLHASMDTPVDTEQLLRMYNYLALNMANPAYREILPQWIYDTPELFSQAFDELSYFEREQTGPLCLVHGDSHQGNSFLRANGERVWHDWQLVRKGRPWRDLTYFMLGALTIEERRASASDLIKHYRETLIGLGAEDVPDQNAAFEQFRRWPVYGMQAWLANVSQWGQSGLHIVERFFTAAEDLDTIAVLTAGKTPRRQVQLGVNARPIASGLQHLLRAAG